MFPIYFYFELAALLVGVFNFRIISKTTYTSFLPFMGFIVVYETCSLYNVFAVHGSNLWIVNIIAIIEFLFYGLMIRRLSNFRTFNKLSGIVITLCVFYSLVTALLITGFWRLNISAIIIQTIIMIMLIGRYFWELMQVPFSSSLDLIRQPGFWLNTGVLFYYLGKVLFFASFSYMAYKQNLTYLYLFVFIDNLSNAILYSCLITCFLCIKLTRASYQL